MPHKLFFTSDYMEGAHPAILRRLAETNMISSPGYGTDEYTAHARDLIRSACGAPEADVFFLTGGTQTNATVIDALLRSYQGVIAADTGHISTHEAGAIELGGHKVLTLPHKDGKITATGIASLIDGFWQDGNHEHMVMPGMVYLSQPTEFGTLYSLAELREISGVCRDRKVPLYVDGARLAYALACPENDVRLPDLAELCDVFYIGGTKCGALFGEAVVIPRHGLIPHFFTIVKQHGALLAKGRIAGIQFETLFTDGLYEAIGTNAIKAADRIRSALKEKGYDLPIASPTNQIFISVDDETYARLQQQVELSFWEKLPAGRTVLRIATSWATVAEAVDALIRIL
ncbi:MAG: low specificity L-threonine aldolase [Lachnospiraceae bacterium]|nr:low specificity L-threonine aldolase [Lachnospiraceae bacterium]